MSVSTRVFTHVCPFTKCMCVHMVVLYASFSSSCVPGAILCNAPEMRSVLGTRYPEPVLGGEALTHFYNSEPNNGE